LTGAAGYYHQNKSEAHSPRDSVDENPAMRSFPLRSLFGLSLAILSAAATQAQNTPASLEAQVHAIAAEHHGDIALFA